MEQDKFTKPQWSEYYNATQGLPPRDTVLRALAFLEAESDDKSLPRLAVDIGCGEGRDTVEILRRGWPVFAFDGQEEAITRLLSRTDLPTDTLLTARILRYEIAVWPRCNLANAAYSLPFCAPEVFPTFWKRILVSLMPGGIFCGQLFGDRDGWAGSPGMTHHTREQAESLLSDLRVEHFQEEERDSTTAIGSPKHWHVFHFVARKP